MYHLTRMRRAYEQNYNLQLNSIKENIKTIQTTNINITLEEFKKKKEEERQIILNNYKKRVNDEFEKSKNKNTGYDNTTTIYNNKIDLETKLKILEQLRN